MSASFPMTRFVLQVVASVGVSKVIGDIITNNTKVVTTADAVKVWTGTIVLGSMVAEQASKHVDMRMDQVATWYENRKTEETTAK